MCMRRLHMRAEQYEMVRIYKQSHDPWSSSKANFDMVEQTHSLVWVTGLNEPWMMAAEYSNKVRRPARCKIQQARRTYNKGYLCIHNGSICFPNRLLSGLSDKGCMQPDLLLDRCLAATRRKTQFNCWKTQTIPHNDEIRWDARPSGGRMTL
jgi:hypothetical protein